MPGAGVTSPTEPGWSRSRLAVAVAGGLALIASYVLAVHSSTGQRVEDLGLRRARVQELARHAGGGPPVGEIANAGAALLVAVLMLLAFRAIARRRYAQVVRVAVLCAGALLTTELLKLVLLPRPDLAEVLGPGDNTLPSGHTTVAFAAVAGSLLLVRQSARWSGALLGATAAGAVGEATLVAGWHRASDVVAAYAVVLMWTALVAGWRRPPADRGGQAPPGDVSRRRVAVAALAVAAAVLAATGTARLFLVAGSPVATVAAIQAIGAASLHAQVLIALAGVAAATALLVVAVTDTAE